MENVTDDLKKVLPYRARNLDVILEFRVNPLCNPSAQIKIRVAAGLSSKIYSQSMPSLITLAGTPPAKTWAGIALFTTDPAAITDPVPIVAPFKMVEFIPIQTWSPIMMG